jgi:hypothetical protein
MTARLGAGSQKADFDIAFGAVQLVGSVGMAATVAFGSVRSVNLSGNLPFFAVCNAVKDVHVRMAVGHLGDFAGRFGLCTRSMFMVVFRFFCSGMCALALTLEGETHIVSLIGVDAVSCTY